MAQSPSIIKVKPRPHFLSRDHDKGDFTVGKIVKILGRPDRVRVEWQIPEFLSLDKETSTYFVSPGFNFSQALCFLVILPFGDRDNKGWIGIYLYSENLLLKKPMTYTIGIRRTDGTLEKDIIFQGKCTNCHGFFGRGRKQFLSRIDLFLRRPQLLSNMLNITCSLQCHETLSLEDKTPSSDELEVECLWDTKEAKGKEPEVICISSDSSDSEEETETKEKPFVSSETETKDLSDVVTKHSEHESLESKSISNLRDHLRRLLLEGLDHDVTIKVNKREFKAHKDMLRVRSPVFEAMFKHNMEENTSGSISIDDCDPDMFDEFLKYVYTGDAEINSAKSAVALYYAGDKYDFPVLKERCVEYLMESLSTTAICDVIEMAKTHGEADLLECAVSFFSKNLEDILETVEWQRFLQSNTTAANELYIKAFKSSRKKSGKMSA